MSWSPSIPLYGGVHFSPSIPDPDNITILDHNALPMIRDFHKFGIKIDIPYLHSLSKQIDDIKGGCEAKIVWEIGDWHYTHPKTHQRTPFKIGSRDHLSQLLFEDLKIQGFAPLPRTPKDSRYEVSEEILEPFRNSHPIVSDIIEWHKSNKIQNTYTDTLPNWADENSRIHTKFNPTQAATGRLASSKPNLQNIPIRTKLGKEIRSAFIAEDGWALVSSDYSQIEMVWAAHRSQDPTMMKVFERGEDIHTRTTCNVFHLDYNETAHKISLVESKIASPDIISWYTHFKQFQRLPCKTVGFGVLYGQTPEGLQASLAAEGVHWTLEECTLFIESKFFEVYPGLKIMLESDYRFAMRYGLICDDFGRVRLVPEAKSKLFWIASEGTRKAGNHPEQASAQGTIKIAMARLQPIFEHMGSIIVRVLLQIHDQIIVEAREDYKEEIAHIMRTEMEAATPLSIPVRASSDIGYRWSDL